MDKQQVVERIKSVGLVPVIRVSSAEEAMKAAKAIRAGGIDILEITMTVRGAVRVIEQMADRFGNEVLIGAGTVLDSETARACILAGAQFLVSPVLNLGVIECANRYGVPAMPGALTPTEVVTAWQAGASMVKIFPASAVGGASYLKALKGPLPQVEMIPTGGVNLKTAADFIRAGASALGVGGDLVDVKALREGKDDLLTERARQYLACVAEGRGLVTSVA